ncbi:MAG: DUF6088 family protein [Leptospirillum sp.]
MGQVPLMEQIQKRISRSKSNVFIRKDFMGLGGYDQIGRALRSLVADGKLVKVGYGVYVKAKPTRFPGVTIPVVDLLTIGMEAMRKLGIRAEYGRALRRYNEGKSTQIPGKTVIDVKGSRITRRIGLGGENIVRYER